MNITKIWYDELRTVFHDVGIILFVIILPLAYPLLYAYVYTPEVQRDTPVVVVDDSKSVLSREFVRKVDATPDVQVVGNCLNINEAYTNSLLNTFEFAYDLIEYNPSCKKARELLEQTLLRSKLFGIDSNLAMNVYLALCNILSKAKQDDIVLAISRYLEKSAQFEPRQK